MGLRGGYFGFLAISAVGQGFQLFACSSSVSVAFFELYGFTDSVEIVASFLECCSRNIDGAVISSRWHVAA